MDRIQTLLFIIGTIATFDSQAFPFNLINNIISGYKWENDLKDWTWKGESDHLPNTSNIPSFYSDGSFYWSQTPDKTQGSNSTEKRLVLRIWNSVIQDSTFHFRYWYYTAEPAEDHGLYIYIKNAANQTLGPLVEIHNNTKNWADVKVDCNEKNCCQWTPPTTTTKTTTSHANQNIDTRSKRDAPSKSSDKNCYDKGSFDIEIKLDGESAFAAISCVSIGDRGCGPLPSPPTTTTTTIKTTPTKIPTIKTSDANAIQVTAKSPDITTSDSTETTTPTTTPTETATPTTTSIETTTPTTTPTETATPTTTSIETTTQTTTSIETTTQNTTSIETTTPTTTLIETTTPTTTSIETTTPTTTSIKTTTKLAETSIPAKFKSPKNIITEMIVCLTVSALFVVGSFIACLYIYRKNRRSNATPND